MFRSLRAVVMWLIALTIPVQGMAIAVMPLCPPSHHAAISVDEATDPAPSAGIDHAAHHGAQQADGSGHHHGDMQPDQSGHSGHDMLKCCSATCTMAAVTTPVVSVPTRAGSPAPLQAVAQIYRGVTLDGLDRPPKHILA